MVTNGKYYSYKKQDGRGYDIDLQKCINCNRCERVCIELNKPEDIEELNCIEGYIVKNKNNEVSSCDISQSADLSAFNQEYLKYTAQVAESSTDRDLSEENMVIGTSAIIDTEIDGAVGMNSGIFNNPFMIWGRYRKKLFRYYLPISFQFHHTQMDGAHAGRFLANLQNEIKQLR